MTLHEGATNEINSRWPEHKQRNVGIVWEFYGEQYAKNMMCGIQLVRDHYHELKLSGVTEWSVDPAMTDLLNSLLDEVDVSFRI